MTTDAGPVLTQHAAPTLAARVALLARDIKLSHSVFALPWALLATFLAAHRANATRLPYLGQLGLVILCMVLARTVAMAANRLLDARLDKLNPRTARRAVPSGKLSVKFMAGVVVVCGLAFVAATGLFTVFYRNVLPPIAAVPVLLFLVGYPFLKRFTPLCHYYLGLALALAPVCAWAAIAGSVALEPLLMAAAVLLWTAGFDVIYACQDYASDVEHGVFSVPAKLGVPAALWVARGTHLLCVAALVALGWFAPELSTIYFAGVGIAAGLLVIENAIVSPTNLSKVNLAFFTINGVISLLLGTLGVIDIFFIAPAPARTFLVVM